MTSRTAPSGSNQGAAPSTPKGNPAVLRVLIADDHDLFSDMLKAFLETLHDGIHVETARTLSGAIQSLQNGAAFDLILLDFNMPGMNCVSGIGVVKQHAPNTPVAIVSGTMRRPDVLQAMASGAAGFIPKTSSAKALRGALDLLLHGEKFLPATFLDGESEIVPAGPNQLTAREAEVLDQLNGGRSNKEIAVNLGISELTVKTHLQKIFRKIGAKSRADAVRIGLSGPSTAQSGASGA